MEFHTRNTDRRKFGTSKYVVITSFSKVSIFHDEANKKHDKIIYMHAQDDFTIEHLNGNEEYEAVMGPQAGAIVCQILEAAKKNNATLIWTAPRFKDSYHSKDVLAKDFVDDETERRQRREHNEEDPDPLIVDEDEDDE